MAAKIPGCVLFLFSCAVSSVEDTECSNADGICAQGASMVQMKTRISSTIDAGVESFQSADVESFSSEAESNAMRYHQALATLRTEQDLSNLDESMYLAFNTSETKRANCVKSFNTVVKAMGLEAELSAEERQVFKDRLCAEMISSDAAKWRADLRRELQCQKPAVYEKLVEVVNAAGAGFHMEIREWMKEATVCDIKSRNGLETPKGAEETMKNPEKQKSMLIQHEEETSFPSVFDAREKWANCARQIGSVRNQANCGSCWAFASATVVDGRMCIKSPEKFSGRDKWVSAGYITLCGSQNGCGGGGISQGVRYAATSGVPSGFFTSGCVPYHLAGGGGATNHMSGSRRRAPSCPSECTNDDWSSTLKEDTWYPRGLQSGRMYDWHGVNRAKQAIYDGGSIILALYAGRGWSGYKGGIYSPGCALSPNHAVAGIGFGKGYILGVNSYGTDWGMKGLFKVAECTTAYYFVPGAITSLEGGSNSTATGSTPSRPRAAPTKAPTPAPTKAPKNNDSCRWSKDSFCDEPMFCKKGTDCTDCENCN